LIEKIRNRKLTIALYEQVEGIRFRGRQPNKWKDNAKEDLTAHGMNMHEISGGQQQEQEDLEKSC